MVRLLSSTFLILFSVCAWAQSSIQPVLKGYDPLVYPPIARAARVAGVVTVQFQLNDSGEPTSVSTTDGPESLRSSAEEFVRSCRYRLSPFVRTPGKKYLATIQYNVIEGMIESHDAPSLTVQSDRTSSSLLLRASITTKISTSDSHRLQANNPVNEPIQRINTDRPLPKPTVPPSVLVAGSSPVDKWKAQPVTAIEGKLAVASGTTATMTVARVLPALPAVSKVGIDPNQRSPYGDTPLMILAMSGHWSEDLVKAGADINGQNNVGQTALMILVARAEVDDIHSALQAGANPLLKDAMGRTALDYLRLASCGKNPIFDPITDGWTSFHKCTALDEDDVKVVKTMLSEAVRKRN
jgi:TonB family protein